MGKWSRRILTGVLALCVAAAVIVGVERSIAAGRMERQLENVYTQRLLEAQEHLQAISVKLGKSPLAGDTRLQVELLTGVSRQADAVVAGLSALPLSHAAMGDTVKFCNQLADYAMMQALLTAAGQPPPPETLEELLRLRDQCSLLCGQLAVAQESMLAGSLRFAGQGNVFYAPAQLSVRPLEAVADQDHGMDYPTMVYDGAFSDATHFGQPKALGDKEISVEEAIATALYFVGAERVSKAEAAGETAGVLAGYSVLLTLTDGTALTAEVTRQGGEMLWLMPEHASFTPALTVEDCASRGLAFLQSRGYGAMEANHIRVYDGLCVINYVAVQDETLLYPDLVKLQLRMDTGEVVGLEANNYLMNHHERENLAPVLTKAQAVAKVPVPAEEEKARLCLIPQLGTERLCYEIPVTYADQEYRVYIDALTGEEADVLLMLTDAQGSLAA